MAEGAFVHCGMKTCDELLKALWMLRREVRWQASHRPIHNGFMEAYRASSVVLRNLEAWGKVSKEDRGECRLPKQVDIEYSDWINEYEMDEP